MKTRHLSVIIILTCLLSTLRAQPACSAKNVILMIGDGMGLAQASFLIFSTRDTVWIEQFPVVGIQKTYSFSSLLTDSGAAATAIACGVKTYNSAIGVTPDTVPCTTILELAQQRGMKTGIVVTSSVVHATPAAFVAHQELRGFHEAIADDLVKTGPDYIVGGGLMYLSNRYSDERNLIKELEAKDFTVSDYTRKSFHKFSKDTDARMAYFSAYTEPLPVYEGRESLAEITAHALKVLSSSVNGFILVVEGSQIDFALHGNDANYLLSELTDFNDAIGVAHRFAQDNDDTLVIVTGDHETGLMSIKESIPGKKVHIGFETRSHSHFMVPVYASGPCAELFSGLYENTEIFHLIRKATGL